jgi:hypothetical protein
MKRSRFPNCRDAATHTGARLVAGGTDRYPDRMSDRLFFPLALAAVVALIALAVVWP